MHTSLTILCLYQCLPHLTYGVNCFPILTQKHESLDNIKWEILLNGYHLDQSILVDSQSKVVIFFFFFLPFLRSLYPMHIIQAQTRFQAI